VIASTQEAIVNKIRIWRLISVGFISWLMALGIDFFLHAGLFADLYTQSTTFLLAPEDAFRLIPLGYLSILFQIILLLWLVVRLGIQTWKEGAIFGVKLGLLLGSSMVLGMISISTMTWQFLLVVMFAQIVELAVTGAIIASGMKAEKLRPILVRVIALVIFLLILTIAIQSQGWTPRLKGG